MYDDQGYGQIKLFLKLWRSPETQAGKLLRVTMSWAQFCVGTSAPVLQDVVTKWPHFKAKWLKSLRQYLWDINGQIILADNYVPRLQRNKDHFLMDLVLASKKFGPTAIKRINYCQLYLNIVLLSDITSPNGCHLDKAAYKGHCTCLSSMNPGHKVDQTKPNDKVWKEWRKFLHCLIHQDTALTLKEVLAEWIVQPSCYSRS